MYLISCLVRVMDGDGWQFALEKVSIVLPKAELSRFLST